MSRAIDVAKYLVHLAGQETEPALLTNLHIQKLLYYAQSWSLANSGEALFIDPIEAWRYGPVVPNVYHSLKVYGRNQVILPKNETALSDREKQHIARVWDYYKCFSAGKLVEMTHNDDPWLCRQDDEQIEASESGSEMPHIELGEFFRNKADLQLKQFGLSATVFAEQLDTWKSGDLKTTKLSDYLTRART